MPGAGAEGGPRPALEQGPWLPGLITLGTTYIGVPVAVTALFLLESSLNSSRPLSNLAMLAGPAVGLSAGHFYAGDPWRGLGLGALVYPVAGIGVLAAGWTVHRLYPLPNPPGPWDGLGHALVAAGAGIATAIGYSLFVAADANDTARRLVSPTMAPPTPRPGLPDPRPR